jgi:hypothetical protein
MTVNSSFTNEVMRLVARTVLALLVAVTMAPANSLAAQGRPGTNSVESERVVREFVAALDQHSAERTLALVEDHVVLLATGPDSIMHVGARGKPALGRMLAEQFAGMATIKMTLESVSTVGPWIAAHVRGEQKRPNGMSASMALMVFEVRRGKIQRIWQYPAWVSGSNMPMQPDTASSRMR